MADETPPTAPGADASTPPASSTAATAPSRGSRRAAPPAGSEAPSSADGTGSETSGPDADAAEDEATAAPELRPGWYRNAGLTPLTVQPDGYPSAYLKPGGAAWLPDDPCHAHIEPCDAPADAEADTKPE